MRNESEGYLSCASCGCIIGTISGPMYSISNKGATYYSDVGYLCGQCTKERERQRERMRSTSVDGKVFESERVNDQQKIWDLERELRNVTAVHSMDISKMQGQIRELKEKNRKLEEWNDQLLSYLNLSEENNAGGKKGETE